LCRLAAAKFISRPSEEALLHFLSLPKVALRPAIKLRDRTAGTAHLAAYPNVPFPSSLPNNAVGDDNKLKAIDKLVRQGRLGTAANLVRDETKVAEVSEEIVEGLRAKHPAGEARPFGPTVGPAPVTAVPAEDVSAGLDSFKRFTQLQGSPAGRFLCCGSPHKAPRWPSSSSW